MQDTVNSKIVKTESEIIPDRSRRAVMLDDAPERPVVSGEIRLVSIRHRGRRGTCRVAFTIGAPGRRRRIIAMSEFTIDIDAGPLLVFANFREIVFDRLGVLVRCRAAEIDATGAVWLEMIEKACRRGADR